MASTICLSTDMSTIYVISSNNLSSFSLASNGVTVSLSGKDISVRPAASIPAGITSSFDTATGQYTTFFDETGNALAIIGIMDMGIPRQAQFNLSGNSININLQEGSLNVVS